MKILALLILSGCSLYWDAPDVPDEPAPDAPTGPPVDASGVDPGEAFVCRDLITNAAYTPENDSAHVWMPYGYTPRAGAWSWSTEDRIAIVEGVQNLRGQLGTVLIRIDLGDSGVLRPRCMWSGDCGTGCTTER